MKKLVLVVFGIMVFCFSTQNAQAQTKDYFVGKWSVLVSGTPKGDATSIFTFERVDNKLTGYTKTDNQEPIKFSRIQEEGDELTAYFTSASGYEVYLYIKKVDDNKVEGSMMDMFDAVGKRIVEEKK